MVEANNCKFARMQGRDLKKIYNFECSKFVNTIQLYIFNKTVEKFCLSYMVKLTKIQKSSTSCMFDANNILHEVMHVPSGFIARCLAP